MMSRFITPRNKIFKQRLYFLLEALIIFLIVFLFLLYPTYFLFLIDESSKTIISITYYFLRAMIIIIAIVLGLILSNFILQSQKRKIILEEDVNPSVKFIDLYSVKKANYKYQILYGILILFLVFIPLDFLTYLFIPEMLDYQAYSLGVFDELSINSYLVESYFVFFISVIIIQISVAVYEEALNRGFLSNRGSEYFNKMSAVIISSFFFGLGHFSYIFYPSSPAISIVFPLIWFFQTFFVGIILAMILIRKRWIIPGIVAHALNNIITAHAIWNYLQGNDFIVIVVYLYLPLLVISVGLLIWQFSRVKEGLHIGIREFSTYFKNDLKTKETTTDKIIRIMLDFLFGLILYGVGIILI
ncbi:MAG: CPBP family intramembrane metalloprotease [Promethearchaeota archaeon]|nr:MAG: CPBP family intramembrane metalloprotease [Candidatus Lokiarchaeota archaeon]